MSPIEHLLCRLAFPYHWQKFLDDILLCLLDHRLAFTQLLLKLVVFGTCNHTFLFSLLSEGCVGILIFPVWVLPKLSDERLSFFVVPATFPVRYDLLLQHLLTNLLLQCAFSTLLKVRQQYNICQLFLDVIDLFENVEHAFQVLFFELHALQLTLFDQSI
jgi:hypothetical protein